MLAVVSADDGKKQLPEFFHETAKKAGMDAEEYVEALKENCNKKGIAGACQILERHGLHEDL